MLYLFLGLLLVTALLSLDTMRRVRNMMTPATVPAN